MAAVAVLVGMLLFSLAQTWYAIERGDGQVTEVGGTVGGIRVAVFFGLLSGVLVVRAVYDRPTLLSVAAWWCRLSRSDPFRGPPGGSNASQG